MKNFNNTFLLRFALATIFLSHNLHGIFIDNDVNNFENLQTKPWGQKEFVLLDPDNNLLTFGQSIE